MLSPAGAAALARGRDLKRCVRAAAAYRGLYDDTAIAQAAHVNRGAVGAWWDGAQMKPETLQRIADATGLSFDELTRYVYLGGPLPRLPQSVDVASAVDSGQIEGARRLHSREPGAEDPPPPSPARRVRAGSTGSE